LLYEHWYPVVLLKMRIPQVYGAIKICGQGSG
jgi:hypothetical protein